MKTNPPAAWRRYLLGVAIAVASVVPRVALNSVFGDRFPYTTAVIGVLAAAPLVGEGPGAMVALGSGIALYFLVSDRDAPRFASFLLISALIIWVVAQLRRAHREASASAQLADQRLEQLRLETMQKGP